MILRVVPTTAAAQAGVDFLMLPGWQTVAVAETSHSYEVEALPLWEPLYCSKCGAPSASLRECGVRRQWRRDAPVRGKHVVLHFARHVYKCGECGRTSRQPLPGVDTRRRATDRLIELLGTEAFSKTCSQVSRETGAGVNTVRDIFVEKALVFERSIRPEAPRILGLDEVYIKGRARCVLTDLDARQPLDILPESGMLTLCGYLLQMPQRERVEVVVTDLRRSNFEVIKRVLPQATVVVDRWEVWRPAQQTVVTVFRKVREELSADQRLGLSRASIYLQKSHSRLFQHEGEVLTEIFRQHPELEEAYRLRRKFFAIWNSKDRHKAEKRCEEWMASIPPRLYYAFDPLLRIVVNWREEIFNYFDHRVSNAFTESIIGKIRVLQSIAPTCSFETVRVKVLYERFAKGSQRGPAGMDGISLKRKALKARPKARRAPALRAASTPDERLRLARESKDEFKHLLPRREERPKQAAPSSRKRRKKASDQD